MCHTAFPMELIDLLLHLGKEGFEQDHSVLRNLWLPSLQRRPELALICTCNCVDCTAACVRQPNQAASLHTCVVNCTVNLRNNPALLQYVLVLQ